MKVYCPLMPAPFDNIVQHIFHQPSLQSVTVDELERMTQRHPAFAAAHFLLLRKMQDSQHNRFEQQLQKTALYFNNPLWLQYLLSPDQVQEPAILDHHPFIEPASNKAVESTPESPVNEAEDEHSAAPVSAEVSLQTTTAAETNAGEEAPIAHEAADNHIATATIEEQTVSAVAETTPEPEPVHDRDVTEFQSAISIAEEVFAAKTEAAPVTETAADSDQGDPDATEPALTDQPQELPVSDKPLLKTILEVPAAKDDLLFEPYHTVDYFASQGISLSKAEAAEPKDNFGKQLRSFTEWLKTMKRLPQASIDKMLTEKEDSRVTADAVHSLESKEVITEAMAEVFEKQGLGEKAAEVYRKLSLQNPSKSAYFAAKIEALNL